MKTVISKERFFWINSKLQWLIRDVSSWNRLLLTPCSIWVDIFKNNKNCSLKFYVINYKVDMYFDLRIFVVLLRLLMLVSHRWHYLWMNPRMFYCVNTNLSEILSFIASELEGAKGLSPVLSFCCCDFILQVGTVILPPTLSPNLFFKLNFKHNSGTIINTTQTAQSL